MNPKAEISESNSIQRRIILITFPIGALLALVYAMQSRKGSQEYWLSLSFSLETMILFGVIYFRKELIHFVELTFFYSVSSYLYVLTVFNIIVFSGKDVWNQYFINDTLNGVALWFAVMFMASYMVLSKRHNIVFMTFSLTGLVLIMLYHLFWMGGFQMVVILLRWANVFFGLSVVMILVGQMGQLHRDFMTKDDLTGILNRRELYRVFGREIDRSARYSHQLSVILIDIDRFKQINDQFGHLRGNEVLKEFVRLLRSSLRLADVMGRWGGDEFLLVLPETNLESAMRMAQRLCEITRQGHYEKVSHVTASFGVATYRIGQNLDEILRQADIALYHAKENGRNQVSIFDVSLNRSISALVSSR